MSKLVAQRDFQISIVGLFQWASKFLGFENSHLQQWTGKSLPAEGNSVD